MRTRRVSSPRPLRMPIKDIPSSISALRDGLDSTAGQMGCVGPGRLLSLHLPVVKSSYYTNAMSEEKCATFGVGRMAQDPRGCLETIAFEIHKSFDVPVVARGLGSRQVRTRDRSDAISRRNAV
jgi:hypothetical protein